MQPRRAMQPPRGLEGRGDGGVDVGAALLGRGVRARLLALDPLVEPGQGDAQQQAGQGVWHLVVGPLVGDEAGHAHFVASFTHRTTDRLSTSRSIRSSATSARSRLSSSMSPVDSPSVPCRASRSRATQVPRVPSLIPRSRATTATGFLVSLTIRTAPSRNSRSYLLRFSGIATPYSRCLHGPGGTSHRGRDEGKVDQRQLAEQLLAQAREQGVDLVGPDGLLNQLTKRVLETALEEEMAEHLGYDKHDPVGRNSGNSRNGVRAKTVLTEIGPVEIEVPRDTDASFTPQIVKKRQRRLTGVDEIVLSLTARGLTTGEISAHFAEVYGASVSKETVSKITDKVIEEMNEWSTRPLDPVYPVIFIDAIMVKVR